ncbi:Putative transcriptional regulator [Alloalcanivorax dieselolei B5]|uniref:Putative transcriptional regulator n=1 Tax=Alcanivorax dieselolei (strain DSM 16502 / CGMCC 1.3690 / MCCC 1A00001 / B-5) TaxID=930169 RepID=K0CDD2_ALCDB|nr:LysR family transcriptional regulator [Alloalcanivorax dieselolei]AFT70583.1 Putative transcriptional regulator [Alloalcanivorax dieselolei B5]GGJ85450.1 LysR family transcriptional regulator [Alloalcanivorax dieselolei]
MKARLDHMSTFLSVCDNGSIAAAARALGLSAPAVSKQLSALEQSLEVVLLERTTRRMVLTPAGRIFQEHAVATLRLLDDGERNCLSQIKGEPSGTLRVVAARWLTKTFLVPHLDEFVRRYPAIDLELELAERFPDLEQENVDLIFAMSMAGSNGMVRRSLGKTAYWLCASPDYIERHGMPETPEQLAEHRLITHAMRHPPDRVWLWGSRQVVMRPALRLNDTEAMIEAVKQGLGLAWLHHYMVLEAIEAGHLCRLRSEWEQPPIDVALFYRASGRALPALRHFIDFAVSHCRLPPLPT